MLHYIKSNKSSGPSKASFAMDSDCSLGSFGYLYEFVNNIIWWTTSIDKVQIKMLYAILNKSLPIVGIIFIQPDNQFDSHFLKNRNVIFWSE